MKKTLIALLALSCVAMAVEKTQSITSTTGSAFNENWATTLSDMGYEQGHEYSLTVTVTGGLVASGENAYIMTFADSRYIVNQNTGNEVYFGVATPNGANKNNMPSNWKTTYSFEKVGDAITLTEKEGKTISAWTNNATGTDSAARIWNNALTLNISYAEETGTVITFSYGGSNAATDAFIMPQTSLDLADFSFKGDITMNGNGTLTVKTPEPATATLSLLALAGLAARRRRH